MAHRLAKGAYAWHMDQLFHCNIMQLAIATSPYCDLNQLAIYSYVV